MGRGVVAPNPFAAGHVDLRHHFVAHAQVGGVLGILHPVTGKARYGARGVGHAQRQPAFGQCCFIGSNDRKLSGEEKTYLVL